MSLTQEQANVDAGFKDVAGDYKALKRSLMINVKDFGALGDGLNDDRAAIQAAINYAKSQNTANGGTMRCTVYFPFGNYRLNGPKGLDVTNANGIILQGASNGKYLATGLNGNCTGAIADFTGSTMSGTQGLSFFSQKGEANPAKIGLLFALGMDGNGNESGGLSCFVRDCYFQMDDMPGLNNGLGSIGIVNIRSEQFSIEDTVIKSNLGILYTNRLDVQARRNNNSFASDYFSIKTGIGSMGVISNRAVSIETNGTLQPALMLNGVNGLNFQGYISIGNPGTGGQQYAIEQYQPMFCGKFHGTIEGYRSILYQSATQYQSEFKLAYANVQGALDTAVFYLDSGARMDNADIGVVFGNGAAEMGNRAFVGTALNDNDAPTNSAIVNSKISCSSWPNNSTFVPKLLLRQSENTLFNTQQPFEKKANVIHSLMNHPVVVGVDNSANAGTVTGKILRFDACDRKTKTNQNGGYYLAVLEGTVDVGGFGPASSAAFRTTVHLHQTSDGTRQAVQQNTVIYSTVNAFPSYATITGISGNITFDANGIGSIMLTVTTGAQHAGEAVNFVGRVSLLSNFIINQSSLYD